MLLVEYDLKYTVVLVNSLSDISQLDNNVLLYLLFVVFVLILLISKQILQKNLY